MVHKKVYACINLQLFILLSRGAGVDSAWLHTLPNQDVDGAGTSTAIRPVGLGRVQMMMRHLASVGETYAQSALEDTAWSLWPQASATGSPIPPPHARFPGGSGSFPMRTILHSANDNLANILAMAETVREVLPHIPHDIIFQVWDSFFIYLFIFIFNLSECFSNQSYILNLHVMKLYWE